MFGDESGELLDERDCKIGGLRSRCCKGVEIEKFRAAVCCDGGCGGSGNESGFALCASEGGFKIEHSLDAGGVREKFVRRGGVEEAVEKGHGESVIFCARGRNGFVGKEHVS